MKIFNLNIKDSIFACIAIGMIAIGCEKKLDVQPYQTLSEDFIREFQNEVNWK